MQKSIEKDNPEHYAFTVVDMLSSISDAMPKEVIHMVRISNNTKNSSMDTKIERNKKVIHQKQEVFTKCYFEFMEKVVFLNKCLGMLQQDPIKMIQNEFFKSNLQVLYGDFLKFNFPSERKRIVFNNDTLDIEKLMPGLTEVQSQFTTTKAETDERAALDKPRSSSKKVETVSSGSEAKSSNSAHKTKSTPKKEEKGEENIYDKVYWQELHRFHQERKRSASAYCEDIDTEETKLSPYETELFSYISKYIYSYTRKKARIIIKELEGLKFEVVANKSGKGSLHYVRPTEDNPLFGNDLDYAEAYFNIHLPHNDSEIVPEAYFRFLQSGFSNVFGLTFDHVSKAQRGL